MGKELLDLFGKVLIERVRDQTISDLDKITNGEMKGFKAKAFQNAISNFDKEDLKILEWVIPQIVDRTLHHLLWMFEDEDSLDVIILDDTNKAQPIKELSDGLSGELYTEKGWISRFSKQRYEELKP